MQCPKCKGEVKEQTSLKGFGFWKKKVVISYCGLCDFRNEQVFKISTADKLQELKKRETELELNKITALNTKTHRKDSQYKEDRDYRREDL